MLRKIADVPKWSMVTVPLGVIFCGDQTFLPDGVVPGSLTDACVVEGLECSLSDSRACEFTADGKKKEVAIWLTPIGGRVCLSMTEADVSLFGLMTTAVPPKASVSKTEADEDRTKVATDSMVLGEFDSWEQIEVVRLAYLESWEIISLAHIEHRKSRTHDGIVDAQPIVPRLHMREG